MSAQSEDSNFYSASNRLKFGNQLYAEKDFLRAIEEFKYYLKSTQNDTVQFRLANCLYEIGRYNEASENFKTLFWGSSLEDESRLMFFQSHFFMKDFDQFRKLIPIRDFIPLRYSNTIDRLSSITYFLENKPMPEINGLIKPFPDSVQSKLYSLARMKQNPPKKDVTLAALLSAAIPGAGKVYTEQYTDALIAFLATGLSTYLAVSNFKADHSFRGWLFTGAALFFYGGSIYGSAASAQQYNVKVRMNLDSEIKLFFEQRNYFLPKLNL